MEDRVDSGTEGIGIGMLNGPRRTRPSMTQDAAFWWEGLSARQLRLQRCTACGTQRHPPQPRCVECGDMTWDWFVCAGTGTLHSFVVYRYPELPATTYPYCVGTVELDDGIRVVVPLVPNDGEGLAIGAAVTLAWATDEDGGGWPVFRLAAAS
jgi:uncharacterized OB-fold protein